MTLERRTHQYALQIIHFCNALPTSREGRLIGNQLFRSCTSVGANYRAACRARSKREFIAKLGIVEEEADESLYWLELLSALESANPDKLRTLKEETEAILAMVVASIKTAKGRR